MGFNMDKVRQIKDLTTEFLANRQYIKAFILSMVKDINLTDDILQEVWIKLAESVDKDIKIENLVAWCITISKNLIQNHWREVRIDLKAKNERVLKLVEETFQEKESAREVWKSRQKALKECIQNLPGKSREILELKYEQGLKSENIASLMKNSLSNVFVMLFRIRNQLLDCAEKRLKSEGIF